MRDVLAVLVCLLLVGCSAPSSTIESEVVELKPIEIGVVGPFSGPIAFYGERMIDGFELALGEINDAGGVDGRPLKLLYEDDGCQPQNTVSAVHKLIDADEVTALLGPFCGSSVKAAAEIVDHKKVLLITPGDNFGRLTKYYFSTRYLITREGEELAKLAYENMSVNKVGIIHFDNDWGTVFADTFTEVIESLGGKVSAREPFSYETTDFRTQLTKIANSGADTILVIFGRGGLIYQQIKELGLNLTILSDMGSDEPAEIEGAAGADEGIVYMYAGYVDPEFEERFQARYGRSSGIVNRDAYDALMILRNALGACSDTDFDSDCMADYVESLENYDGASGVLTFEEGGFGKVLMPKTIKNSTAVPFIG